MNVIPVSALTAEASPARDEVAERALTLEHQRLGRHVADVEVTPYQIEKYLDFHRRRSLVPRNEMDRLLLRLSHAGKLGLILADAYSGTIYRVCVVRMKMMLTLAILECSPPSFHVVDAPDAGGRLVYLRMLGRVIAAFVALLAACVLLMPFQCWFALTKRDKPRGR